MDYYSIDESECSTVMPQLWLNLLHSVANATALRALFVHEAGVLVAFAIRSPAGTVTMHGSGRVILDTNKSATWQREG